MNRRSLLVGASGLPLVAAFAPGKAAPDPAAAILALDTQIAAVAGLTAAVEDLREASATREEAEAELDRLRQHGPPES